MPAAETPGPFSNEFHRSFVSGVTAMMTRRCSHRTLSSSSSKDDVEGTSVKVHTERCPNEAIAMVSIMGDADPLRCDTLCAQCILVAIERAPVGRALMVQRF